MKIDTQKMISVALMTTGVVMLLCLGVQVSACTALRTGATLGGDMGFVDDIAEQEGRAVYIRVRCGASIYGSSGVAIGGTRVMTAAHSIPCWGQIWVTTKSGVTLWATVAGVNRANDIATLNVKGLTAPKIALGKSPRSGDTICAATAHPDRGRICGSVAYVKHKGPGAIISGMAVVSGNSGSGVYDMQGGLVGIAVTGCKVPGCGRAGASAVGPEQ